MSIACKMRILSFNYPFQSNVSITGSSENINFPAANIGKVFRSEVWRSSGNFIIDSTNNKIDFVEVLAGPELTATIPSATYTPTTLEAAIKAAMEAVSVDTFTINLSGSFGVWTMLTSGTFLSLLWLTGTNTATSIHSTIGFAIADKTGATTYTGASIAIHTEETILIDLFTEESIDTFAILFDPRVGINLSDSAVIKLQANATNEWSAPAVDITLAIDNRESIITHFFTANQDYRYWRIKIVDPKNFNLFVELGTVFLGKGKTLTRNIEKGFTFKRRDRSRIRRNQFGHVYADELPIFKSLEFSYKNHDKVDLDILEDIYKEVGIKKPIFIAVDPEAVIWDKDKFTLMGRFTRQLESRHVVRDIMTTSFRVEEVM